MRCGCIDLGLLLLVDKHLFEDLASVLIFQGDFFAFLLFIVLGFGTVSFLVVVVVVATIIGLHQLLGEGAHWEYVLLKHVDVAAPHAVHRLRFWVLYHVYLFYGEAGREVSERVLEVNVELTGEQFTRLLLVKEHSLLLLQLEVLVLDVPVVRLGVVRLTPHRDVD